MLESSPQVYLDFLYKLNEKNRENPTFRRLDGLMRFMLTFSSFGSDKNDSGDGQDN